MNKKPGVKLVPSPPRAPPTRKPYSAGDAPELRKNPELYELAASPANPSPLPAIDPRSGRKRPEVLAPAGGWDQASRERHLLLRSRVPLTNPVDHPDLQLHAAVEAGADAVYFGLHEFSARARASNFDPVEELPEVMRYLRDRGVKGYVALNVLVYDTELVKAEALVRRIAEAGVDAVIAQDLGVCRLIKRVAPGLEVHASTQMSITSGEGAEFARLAAGVSRVVVGRELSVREIEKTRRATRAEVEVFVHGALCVSYSGQCFASESWGGRSANRGACSQACRMPYGLVVNGRIRDLQDLKYLLSPQASPMEVGPSLGAAREPHPPPPLPPQDLMALDQIPALIEAGVESFKIEGRLKGPEYVALTTQLYRRAVDTAWAGLLEGRPTAPALGEQEWLDLQQVFARGQDAGYRGLTPGFLEGSRHQDLVRGRAPRHRGVFLGPVLSVSRRGVLVDCEAPIRRGDGVVFDQGNPEARGESGDGMHAARWCSDGPLLLYRRTRRRGAWWPRCRTSRVAGSTRAGAVFSWALAHRGSPRSTCAASGRVTWCGAPGMPPSSRASSASTTPCPRPPGGRCRCRAPSPAPSGSHW